jgi:hypothetical protein
MDCLKELVLFTLNRSWLQGQVAKLEPAKYSFAFGKYIYPNLTKKPATRGCQGVLTKIYCNVTPRSDVRVFTACTRTTGTSNMSRML